MKNLIIIFCFLFELRTASAEQVSKKELLNIVKVTVTTYGVAIAPVKVPKGRVVFLVDNQTMLSEPELTIRRNAKGSSTDSPAEKLEDQRIGENRALRKGVLNPGEYSVGISAVRNKQAILTVEP